MECRYCERVEGKDMTNHRVSSLWNTTTADGGGGQLGSCGNPLAHAPSFESLDMEKLRHDQSQDPILSCVQEWMRVGQKPE